MVESLVTAGASPLLAPGESPVAIRRRPGTCAPLSPVVLPGWVLGGIGRGDEPRAHHPRPGACPEGGMARLTLKDPAVPPGSQGPAPVKVRIQAPPLILKPPEPDPPRTEPLTDHCISSLT
jgi:hypothetical protein